MLKKMILPFIILTGLSNHAFAQNGDIARSVWVNHAIISTYTLSSNNLVERQKESAKYFTAQAWINYTKALSSSGLTDMIKKNQYQVTAVAMRPPEVKSIASNQWQAEMPIMVWYKNPQFQQKQTLSVSLTFKKSTSQEGVQGYAITSFQSKVIKPLCQCQDGGKEETPSKKPEEQNGKMEQNKS